MSLHCCINSFSKLRVTFGKLKLPQKIANLRDQKIFRRSNTVVQSYLFRLRQIITKIKTIILYFYKDNQNCRETNNISLTTNIFDLTHIENNPAPSSILSIIIKYNYKNKFF